MSRDFDSLQPKLLWDIFKEICATPHSSGHEAELREFLKKKAESAGLRAEVDPAGNLLISKPATKGMEKSKTLILQGHLDMVPQKNSDMEFDFAKDPVRPRMNDGWVCATGTTLGADNGIGVAAAMALLLSEDIPHGPLKALFTIEEETGLSGALNLSPEFARGDILFNLDSEDEGKVFIGCAGGVRSSHEFAVEESPVPPGHVAVSVAVSGLKGGHSGCDINAGRANALKLMAELLGRAASGLGVKVADIRGGDLDNAIPREAFAVALVGAGDAVRLAELAAGFESEKRRCFGEADPGLKITVSEAGIPDRMFGPDFQRRLLGALLECPHGVVAMSEDFPGVVRTSTNLAATRREGGRILVRTSQRSSDDAERDRLAARISALFESAGAACRSDNRYPGWAPRRDSEILQVFGESHERLFGKKPEAVVIHAGLECGIIHSLNPGLEMISFGPDIKNAHSPSECVSVGSTARFWILLKDLASRL